MTCGDLLDEAAGRRPEHEAVVLSAYEDRGLNVRWTYAELRERAREAGRALIACGLRPGDRMAVWATNLPDWLLLQFGAAYAGTVLVPLNPLLRAAEVAYVLGRSGARAIFVEPHNRGVSLWDMVAEAAVEAPGVTLRVALGNAPDDAGPSWAQWLAGADGVEDAALPGAAPGDLAQIQFTSGTTGFPKGAALTHRGLANNARMYSARAEMDGDSRHVTGMPLFHCGGCVLSAMGTFAAGGTLMPLVTFDAARAVRTIEAERATFLAAVPTMMLAVEEEHDRGGGSLASLTRVGTGGTVVPPEVGRRWAERFGVTFTNTYGLTEASPVITQSSPSDDLARQLTCGPALANVEWDVADPTTGEEVPVGRPGEVRTRGWLVMREYFGDPEATAAAITPDGWLRTGDLGVMDADGYLQITGRAKDMVIRGGENVYPAEIESALRELTGVLDANVIGVPDERYGEVCAAFVRLAEGAELTHESMRQALSQRLARYKVPAYLRVVDAFPVTPSGKVQKFRLRELFLQEPAERA